ncbi:MAG TPA: hypothetical protein VEJ63_07985 [Planctomycetota bacterium]|nr:hypothetical protein [Planctomycetota bacterium]
MRGSVLSDKKVAEVIKKDFVLYELNVTEEGFPEDVPALKPWETAYKKQWLYKMAFATSAVISPDGQKFFGSSGSGFAEEAEISPNYNPDLFIECLGESRKRYDRWVELEKDTKMSGLEKWKKRGELDKEILASVQPRKKE